MTYYYILEIQTYSDGTSASLTHAVSDVDSEQAYFKAEGKYHEVLAAAALSALPLHSAIMVSAGGTPIHHDCYMHNTQSEI